MESTLGFSVVSESPVNAFVKPTFTGFSNERYTVRLAENRREIKSALRLRYDVFNVELGGREIVEGEARLEFDNYDLKCRHLIVISKETGRIEFTAERPKDFWAENGYDWYSGH